MTDYREMLKRIRTFPSLIKFLQEELDWPIIPGDFEELTFDYTPEELGIDTANAAKIKEIKRLRPLEVNQPWGIFFVMFEPKRLPVVALRRILSRVVLKKRASANKSESAAWKADDLLFVSNYGEGEERQISFAHFAQHGQKKDLPTLKVLGWDNLDTPLHLDHVADMLVGKLFWPDDPENEESWRKTWREAFTLRHQEVIDTSKDLAMRLAELARAIRDRIKTALPIETAKGPLTKLMKAFQETLVHDLDPDGFSDMYAQTIAYGLLSARVENPQGKTADDLAVQMTNPFLKELMETFLDVGGRKGKIGKGPGLDFDELGVSEVVELLDAANMEAVILDFGDLKPEEDPVIHFYELFLQEYDPQEKVKRGIFYTPRPVVSYIVRSVDEMLRTEFDLADGLADTATWGDMAARQPGLKIPQGTKSDEPFVEILDPATGTGTFLVEVIDLIHKKMKAKWQAAGHSAKGIDQLWNDYVPQHLLPRLYGYELLMAPYAIAHMKLGLKLYETGYRFGSDERVRVYLTNALEPDQEFSGKLAFMIPALAHEAQAVNAIKRHQRFTVVIGNPPYSGISSNRNDWIEGLLKGETPTYRSMANYYEVNGESLREKKIWLQDDYVKFMRLSHFLLEQSSVGIHGMITNHSYVDSPTCRGMRFQMLHFFSLLNFVDLHGSTKKGENNPDGLADKNVFDILPGVAIAVCCRKGQQPQGRVQSFDLWGTRSVKSNWLLLHGLKNVEWTSITPTDPYYLFVKRQLDFDSEYHSYFSLKDIFPLYGTGIQTSRDDFATDLDRHKLEKRLRSFFDLNNSDSQIVEAFGLSDTRGWKIKEVRRASGFDKVRETITKCLFRAFDTRWIALTKDIVDWPRLEVMSCVAPDRLGLLCSRQQSTTGFRHALVVNAPVDMFCISNKSREGQTLFPLFAQETGGLFHSRAKSAWRVNLGARFANELSNLLAKDNAKSQMRDIGNVLNYLYAILHSPVYRTRYADLLKMDYPRLPLTSNLELFRSLARMGGELVALHLVEAPVQQALSARYDQPAKAWRYDVTSGHRLPVVLTFTGPAAPVVEKVGWSDDTVWIDAAATKKGQPTTPGSIGFHGVPDAVWNFHIGGYQVCQKWLKDRKGRTLSADDLTHYHRIVIALHETVRLMKEIDEIIDQHGGWPAAFAGGAPGHG